MSNYFLSIVIPVYNGLSNGLPQCLDSIWGQSLSKETYEVICIDDCSTDNSLNILKEYSNKDDRIKIIDKYSIL